MIYFLDRTAPNSPFPDVTQAEVEPNGLLASGGDLSTTRIINAYRHGIFPWYGPGEPILWWSPDPRLVLFPERLHISRSLHKTLRREIFTTTMDVAFAQVIRACAGSRRNTSGTWLVPTMIHAYERLHRLGVAHSVEVWHNNILVGGLYGVALGQVFFGESMFSHKNDASKVALVYLVEQLLKKEFKLIDCQVRTEHLLSMGAEEISRERFVQLLKELIPTKLAVAAS